AVCNAEADLELDVLGGLGSLVDKSLVQQVEQPDGEPRFVMLETIREYGLEQLEATGGTDSVHRAHAEFFHAFLDLPEPKLRGWERRVWLERLDGEHENLRAALRWSQSDVADAEAASRLAAALPLFWFFTGRLSEGRRWCDGALALSGTAPETS